MPTLSATSGATSSITLSNGSPYSLISMRGGGGADIRRVVQQGPAQDGDTDQGYRLAPREIELVIGFQGTTDAVLDGYRDTLTGFFKPLTATPVKLRYVRDDGETRQIDCNVVGSVKIDLLTMHRPGHYHRATIRLRAPDPAWYRLAPGTANFTGSATFASNWWLAGGAIDASQTLMHGGTPSNDEAWSYAGSISSTTSYTIAVRAGFVSSAGTNAYMFTAPTLTGDFIPTFGVAGTETYGNTPSYYTFVDSRLFAGSLMLAGSNVYYFNNDPNGVPYGGANQPLFQSIWFSRVGGTVGYSGTTSYLPGASMKWRTKGWTGAIPLYALYSPGLSESQRDALTVYMNGTAGTAATTLAIAYTGDLPEYPLISLTGPITSPQITNTATGEVLDFTGTTIGAGTTYVIDTRYGYKTVTQGTTSVVDKLTDDSDLSTWHLAPSPIATGGTNLLTVYGSGNGSATNIQVIYYHRFTSF